MCQLLTTNLNYIYRQCQIYYLNVKNSIKIIKSKFSKKFSKISHNFSFQIPMKNSCNTSISSKMNFISDSVHGIVQFGSKICNPSSKLSSMPRPLKFSSSYVSLLIQFSSLPTITTRMTISKMPFQSEIQVCVTVNI